MTAQSLRLKTRAVSRIRAGHPWVYSNELDGGLKGLTAGEVVDLHAPTGAFVARGLVSPQALVAVRILSWNRREDILHPAFFAGRMRQAEQARTLRYPGRRDLRLVNGEGDALPGLQVDRFGDALVVRLNFAGWRAHLPLLEQALRDVYAPSGALLMGDGPTRLWFGDVEASIQIDVDGLQSVVHPGQGPGASYFYDQSDLHNLVAPLCAGKRVLDVYAFSGAAGRRALLAGASSAMAVEKNEDWCALAEESGVLNGLSDRFKVFCDEGKQAIQGFVTMGERFDVIFLDPPTFAKTRKDVKGALPGHTELHSLAMTLLSPGGLLITSLRGVHIPLDDFERTLARAAHESGRVTRVLHRVGGSADHPDALPLPESRVLQSYVIHVGL